MANRFAAVAKLAAPERPSKSQVARALEVVVSTVASAARRFVAGGVKMLYDQRAHNGRTRKVDERFAQYVSAALYETPPDRGWERPTWTRELLCLERARLDLPHVSVCTMGRVLAEIGARLGNSRPEVICPWKRRRRRRGLRELERLKDAATTAEPVFFSEEVDVHLNPKIGRDWMPRGFQRRVLTPGKNVKHYFAGALDARTRRLARLQRARGGQLVDAAGDLRR